VHSQRDRSLLTEGGYFIANTEPRELSARFLNNLTTGIAGCEEELRESHQSEWPVDSSEAGQ